MNHETVAISQLLMDLIHPYEASPNVLDGYTGFLLHCLKHSGLYDEINKSTPVRPALENLKKRLLPYSSTYSQTANRGNSELKDSTLSASEVIYNVGWPLSIPKIQSTQPDISGNSLDWDWTMIHAYLTIVLPNNEAEAKAQEHIKFYNELFEYFSGAFLNTQPPQTQLIADSLFALIDLLLPRDWGKTIIENSTSIKNALTLSVHSLRKHDNPRNDTPAWSHLKCVTNLMKSSAGVEVLKKWNIQPALLVLSSHITNLPAAKLTMSMLNLYPEFEFVSPVFSKFLASPNIEISNIAVDSLRDKRQKTKNFFQTAFKSLVVPYLKTAAEMPDAAKRMPMILSAFFEFLVDDKEAIEYAAQDVDVHKILTKWGPLGYAILFSSQKSLKLCDPPGLVKWWMEDGNHLYLKAFDLASEASFTGKLKEASLSIPDIIVKGKSLMTPPHLFGELSKHEEGVELIKPYIPTLIQQCASKSARDAREAFFALAHFASSPLTTKIVEENDIPNVMLQAAVNSNSLMLRGTLISCFSLFAQSDYFTKFLISSNWEVIKFGEHQAVVPSDPYAFAHRSEHSDKITINDIPIPAGHEEVCNTLIGLLSPLTSNQCRQTLSNYKAELKLPEVVLFTHSLIGEYPFPDELRKQLELIIEGTPLHVLTEESIKEIDPQLLSEAEARFEIINKRGFNEPEGMRTFPLTN